MPELQTIPARHGVATFVPAGQIIKIINTKGTQVVDTWAFALPKPDGPKQDSDQAKEEEAISGLKQEANVKKKQTQTQGGKKQKGGAHLPSQEEAEKATKDAEVKQQEEEAGKKAGGWGSYIPSVSSLPGLGGGGGKKGNEAQGEQEGEETEQKKNSRTWGSYFTAGKGFSSYIPKQATDTVGKFASYHERDKSKTYLQQLQDFSQTPVGAAGMAAMTGSGYSGSLYAGYQAWNAKSAADSNAMEFMSMPHTRAATLHLRPQINDTMVTNLREPILTLVEDSSGGVHDTLIAACDPARYQGLGVPKWEEHGSCAENLVLALQELNERAGLKGAKAVGAQVTINDVPAPLNLFMNIPWDEDGEIGFHAPKSKAGGYVRFKAERDVVVVMSACPQDVLEINGRNPTDANFVVEEEGEDAASAIRRTAAPVKKNAPPRRTTTSSTTTQAPKRPAPPSTAPPKKAPPSAAPAATPKQYTPAKKPAAGGPQPVKPAAPAQAPARPKKKPIPPPVKSAASTPNSGSTPLEKKKPRKLARPQAVGGADS